MKLKLPLAVFIWTSLFTGMSFANSFGSQPLTLVVPFAPGGNADIVSRSIAVPMSKILGQSVVVDNRGGAGGAIGTALVANARTDGNTLLAATPGQLGTLPHMFKTAYKMSDFSPIGVLSKTSIALIIKHGDNRFKTAEEFIAFVKSNPGKLNVGHAGPGSPNHLAMLQFGDAINGQFTPIAYKGSGPALLDLLSGQIDVIFDQVSSSLPYLKAEKFSALLVLSPTRDESIPDVRTLKEAGLPQFDASTYIGLLAPKDVPAATRDRLTAIVKQVAGNPEFDQGLKKIGSSAYYGDPARFADILKADQELAIRLKKQGRLVDD